VDAHHHRRRLVPARPQRSARAPAAERSAARGGGLLGGFGLLPLAMGILVGGLALASPWLLRAVTRVPSPLA
jgi:hypothetical protein